MTPTYPSAPDPVPAARRPSEPAEYSYAAAAASLERAAGQSLKTFGAKEQSGQIASARPAEAPSEPARAGAPSTANGAEPTSSPAGHLRAAGAASAPVSTVSAPAAPSSPPSVSIAISPQANATAPAALAASAAPQTRPTAPGVSTKPETQTPQKIAAPVRAAAPAAIKSPEDFAQVLARRLDGGASEFQLRLDPPELGRIEARMVVGDDGAATLAISFDNQSTFDLFARDEAALRLALASAGFSFPEGGLSFSLQERPAFGEAGSEARAPGQSAVYAAALASVSVIDVRA